MMCVDCHCDTLPGTLTLPPGRAAFVYVTVTVPNTTTVRGLIDAAVVTATSELSPTLSLRVTDTTLVPSARIYLPIVPRRQ